MSKEQIARCPHCGNRTPLEIRHKETRQEELIDTDGDEVGVAEIYYFVTRCKTCDEIALFSNWEHDDDPEDLERCNLLYPTVKNFPDSVPEVIRLDYEEAKKVEKISPTAFAVLIRKALERLCIDKNGKGRDLAEKLESLSKDGLIPETLSKMTHALRTFGNIGAHAKKTSIEADDAVMLDDFFSAVIEYIYVAPNKINKLTEKLSK